MGLWRNAEDGQTSEPVTIVVRRRVKAGSEKFADDFVGQKIQPFWIEEEARKLEKPPAQTGGLIVLQFRRDLY